MENFNQLANFFAQQQAESEKRFLQMQEMSEKRMVDFMRMQLAVNNPENGFKRLSEQMDEQSAKIEAQSAKIEAQSSKISFLSSELTTARKEISSLSKEVVYLRDLTTQQATEIQSLRKEVIILSDKVDRVLFYMGRPVDLVPQIDTEDAEACYELLQDSLDLLTDAHQGKTLEFVKYNSTRVDYLQNSELVQADVKTIKPSVTFADIIKEFSVDAKSAHSYYSSVGRNLTAAMRKLLGIETFARVPDEFSDIIEMMGRIFLMKTNFTNKLY